MNPYAGYITKAMGGTDANVQMIRQLTVLEGVLF